MHAAIAVLSRLFQALSIAIAILGTLVNHIVGPVNGYLWVAPAAMLAFGVVIHFLAGQLVVQTTREFRCMRLLLGEHTTNLCMPFVIWVWLFTACCFLAAVPLFFLLFATLLLYGIVTGTINGS